MCNPQSDKTTQPQPSNSTAKKSSEPGTPKACPPSSASILRSPGRLAFVAIILVAIIIINVVVVLTIPKDNQPVDDEVGPIIVLDTIPSSESIPPTSAPTPSPNQGPAGSVSDIFLELASKGWILKSTLDALKDPNSPQSKAQAWILGEEDPSSSSKRKFVQRFGLATLYFATNGDDWVNNDLWLDHYTPECNWQFDEVPCSNNGKRIEAIVLSNNNLQGLLVPELALINSLTTIELSENPDLSGTLPTEFAKLDNLEELSVSNTALSGPIPFCNNQGPLIDYEGTSLYCP